MATQFDRAFTLTLGGQTIASLSGDPDQSLRVRFKVEVRTSQTPNHIQVIITNLSATTAAAYMAMVSQKAPLTLSAGYIDNSGLIFKGDCWYGINGRESPTDTTLQLFARDGGNAYDYTVVNKALASGSTPKDHVQTIADAMSKFGVSLGYVDSDALSSPSYPRGVSLFGMSKDHLRTICSDGNNPLQWSVQQGQLQVVKTSGYVPGQPFTLNSQTGLIGMPSQLVDGSVMARCLINPALNCGSGNLVKIDQADIQRAVLSPSPTASAQNSQVMLNIAADGMYKIIHLDRTGDSRGNDWYDDLTCIPATGSTLVPADKVMNLN